jgi:hypothetical protein
MFIFNLVLRENIFNLDLRDDCVTYVLHCVTYVLHFVCAAFVAGRRLLFLIARGAVPFGDRQIRVISSIIVI